VLLATSAGAPASTARGVGSATAAAIPLRITIGDTSVDLLDIALSATMDPGRAGTRGRSASARLTAMRSKGATSADLGEVSSAAEDGQSDEKAAADVPLEVPGTANGKLQSATARTSAGSDASRASVGATLRDVELGGSLVTIESATASMSVEVTQESATAQKVLEIPSVGILRVGDLAVLAGTSIASLPIESLLTITNTLQLRATGEFGDLLAQEEAVQAQIDSLQADLDSATAERSASQSQLEETQSQLDAAEAALAAAESSVDAEQTAVEQAQQVHDSAAAAVSAAQADADAAQAALDEAEAQHAAAVAALAAAQNDQATAAALTILSPDAVTALQGLADAYGVPVTVSALNFATALIAVQDAIAGVVASDQAAADAAASDVATAEAARAESDEELVSAQDGFSAAERALADAQALLAADQASVDAVQSQIDGLQAQISLVTNQLIGLDSQISADEGALVALQTIVDDLVAQLAAFEADLADLVSSAPIVTFSGVHITLTASAGPETGTPVVEISFASMSIGGLEIAADVTDMSAVAELLPQVQSAVATVDGVLGLAPAEIGMLEPVQASGVDGAYKYASASFTLFRVSVPIPAGGTLDLSVGDPQVYAEFAPDAPAGGPSSGGDGDAAGGGGSGVPPMPAGVTLPVTGLADHAYVAVGLLIAAFALAGALTRRGIVPGLCAVHTRRSPY
jgi:peptidoglycan hydrolase CwlO-like protein